MKILLILPLLLVASPANAQFWWDDAKVKTSTAAKADRGARSNSLRTFHRAPQRRVIGRQGDCPSERDGYCRSVHDWWDVQNNRN
jgi:hypothetical protein